MLGYTKSVWPERTPRETADAHNRLSVEEKTSRMLARCGLSGMAEQLPQYGTSYFDEELAQYEGHPVAQARILLWRRAEDYWKTGEAQGLLAEYERGDIGPEEWQRLYVSVYEAELYLDHAA